MKSGLVGIEQLVRGRRDCKKPSQDLKTGVRGSEAETFYEEAFFLGQLLLLSSTLFSCLPGIPEFIRVRCLLLQVTR